MVVQRAPVISLPDIQSVWFECLSPFHDSTVLVHSQSNYYFISHVRLLCHQSMLLEQYFALVQLTLTTLVLNQNCKSPFTIVITQQVSQKRGHRSYANGFFSVSPSDVITQSLHVYISAFLWGTWEGWVHDHTTLAGLCCKK